MADTLTHGKTKLENLNPERIAALVEFKKMFGSRWKEKMEDFHLGRPDSRFEKAHLIRQIRNYVTPDPSELEGLIDEIEKMTGGILSAYEMREAEKHLANCESFDHAEIALKRGCSLGSS